MKKTLIGCILCGLCLIGFSTKTKAQQEVSTAFFDQMTIIFGSLEPNRIPYGLLFDMAFEQAQLPNYKGNVLADTNYVNIGEFNAIHQTLRSMRFNSTAATFVSANDIDSLAFLQRQPGRILLSGLFFKYAKIREDALTNNLISQVGSTLYDKYISGVWQNPYQTETVFALAPANDKIQGLVQEVYLPSDLWFSNDLSGISSIEIDAGDGLGYRTLVPGTSVNISYSSVGYKTLTYKINLIAGGSLYSHSKVYVEESPFEDGGLYRSAVPLNMVPTVITATDAFNGSYATGFVTIRYANPSLGLRKPLIVAEGFDPGHITNPESAQGESNINGFISDIANDDSNLRTILLNNPDYDIVYVDWKRGTDNIKKNAQLLKEVIRLVNTLKSDAGSTAKNIIIGQSMGGLVARWALKEMENNNEDHETNLFISYDSPHQGANVPLGYQYLARHIFNLYVKTGATAGAIEIIQFLGGGASPSRVLNLSNTDAARQMLIEYVNLNSTVDNSVHSTWQSQLQTLGYPQGFSGSPLRVVAVSNGSECAAPQIASPNALVLNYEGKGNTRFLGDLVSVAGFYVAAGVTGQPAMLLGILPGKTEIKFDVKINLTNYGGGNRVYYNKITITKKILWLIPVTLTITNKSYNAPSNQLTYDSYPGGVFNTGVNLSDDTFQNWFIKYNITASSIPTFNFVPTTSALDIGSGAVSLTNADYNFKYIGASPPTGTKASPFVNFITEFNTPSTANGNHISIHTRNANWVAAEMLAASSGSSYPTSPNCTFVCSSPPYLTGPVTSGATNTYTVNNLPSGATVRWEVASPYVIVGSNTSSTVNIQRPTSTTQFRQLAAFVITPCGEIPYTTTLVPPIVTATLSGGNGDPCGSGSATVNVPNGANFIWTADGDISIEGLPPGQPYATTSNTVSIVGMNGSITVKFQSYGNTVTAYTSYQAYPININVAANPMYNSEPLVATISALGFNYNAIRWYLDGNLVDTGVESYGNWNLSCGNHSVTVEIDLECGATLSGGVDVERACSGGGWWRTMVVYPNPASSYLLIAPDNEKQQKLSASEKTKIKEYEASLYDVKGKLLLKGRSSGYKLQLDTRKLKADYYYLHIRVDGEKDVIKQQIIVRN